MLIQSDCDPTSLPCASPLSSGCVCVWGVKRKLLWTQATVRYPTVVTVWGRLLYPHLKRVPVKSFNMCFHPFLSRWAAILLPPLQPGLRWPLQPAGSLADPRRGEEVPVWCLLSHLQPHVVAAETQLLRVLLTHGMRRHGRRQRDPLRAQGSGGLVDTESMSTQAQLACWWPARPQRAWNGLL